MAFLAQVASQFVTPGGQIPLGVRQPLIERRNSNDDVVVIRDEEEESVILENYYYARRDGERHVQKHKKYMRDGEMFFRCPVCKKVAKNNISIMKHIRMHLESNREFNPDVSHMVSTENLASLIIFSLFVIFLSFYRSIYLPVYRSINQSSKPVSVRATLRSD